MSPEAMSTLFAEEPIFDERGLLLKSPVLRILDNRLLRVVLVGVAWKDGLEEIFELPYGEGLGQIAIESICQTFFTIIRQGHCGGGKDQCVAS